MVTVVWISQICRLLRSLTRGSLPRGSKCDAVSTDSCCPASCSEPTRYGVRTLFNVSWTDYIYIWIHVANCMMAGMSNIPQCMFTELLFFQAAGVSLQSNMFQPSPPFRPRPRPIRKFTSVCHACVCCVDCSCITKYHNKEYSAPLISIGVYHVYIDTPSTGCIFIPHWDIMRALCKPLFLQFTT